MKIAIVGAGGFIGASLVPVLEKSGHSVVLFPRVLGLGVGNLRTDGAAFQSEVVSRINFEEPDALVNLAWGGLPDYSAENTGMNAHLNFLIQDAWGRTSCKRFVGFGSCLEYGSAIGPLSELTPPVAPNFFGKTKTWLHDHLEAIASRTDKQHLWIRPFWLYGKGQRASSLIPSALRSARDGAVLSLRTPNDFVDFLHVDDLSDATRQLVEHESAEGIFNVGSGKPVKVGDIPEIVFSNLTGSEQKTFSDLTTGSVATWSSNKKVSTLLSWQPQRTIDGFIQSLVESDQEN